MSSRVSIAGLGTRTTVLTVVAVAVSVVSILSAVALIPIGIVSINTIQSSGYSPPAYFSGTQFFSRVASMIVDPQGYIKNITAGAAVGTNTTTYTAGGEAVEFDVVGATTEVRIKERVLTPGFYRAAVAELTAEGVVETIADGLPIPSTAVEGDAGPISDSLAAEFVLSQASASHPGARVPAYDPLHFDVDVSTPGLYAVSMLPSPAANTVCTHPVLIVFGDGVRVELCLSGPAPGAAGGAVPLNGLGVVPMMYIPDVIESRYRGLWDANANAPALSNATCESNDLFYYTVSVNGSSELGGLTTWVSRDLAVCLNGTWVRVGCLSTGVVAFKGRVGAVVPESGDYTPDLLPVNNGTLEDLVLAPIVVATGTLVLPNSQVLDGDEIAVSVTGATVSLTDSPYWPPGGTNTTGYVTGLVAQTNGLVDEVDTVPNAVLTVAGTANQVLVSGTNNVTVSLPQPYTTTSNVSFASVAIGARTIRAVPGGQATIPNVGTSNFVMDAGTQSIGGTKRFGDKPVVLSDNGLLLNTGDNLYRVRVRAAANASSHLSVRHPPDQGASGNIVRTDGAGNLSWGTSPAGTDWVSFTPSITGALNVASSAVQFAFYQTTGASGAFVEVIMCVQISRVNGNLRTFLEIGSPAGAQNEATAGAGRGILRESTIGSQLTGYVENGPPGAVRLVVEPSTQTKSGYWFASFDYVRS